MQRAYDKLLCWVKDCMYSLTKLTNDIYYFENIIEDYELILDSISVWKTVINRDKSFSWDTKTLQDRDAPQSLKDAHYLAKEIWMIDHGLNSSEYPPVPSIVIWKRGVGFGMSPHTDSAWTEESFDKVAKTHDVFLTVLSYFSKDFEGGEITFPEHNISIKPSPGSILVFRGNKMHGLNPVSKGIRTVGSQFYLDQETYKELVKTWETS